MSKKGIVEISPHVRVKKNLGIGILAIAVFLLFEPNVNIIDPLSDVFGYALLCMGLSQIATLNDDVNDSLNGFKKMIIVSALKPVSLAVIYGFFAAHEWPTSLLLFSFCFSLFELIFLIPAYRSLFNGLISIAGRHGNSETFSKRGSVTRGEKLKSFTLVFIIVKVLCATLPEATALTMDIYTENILMYLYDFVNFFRAFGIIISFTFGIIWLIKMLKFIRAFKKDAVVMENITSAFCENATAHEGFFIRKNLTAGVFLSILSAILCIDVHLPDYNIFPDMVAALIFILSAILLRKYLNTYKKVIISSSVYFVTSGIASLFRIAFLEEFGFFTAANYKEEAFFMFIGMCASTVIENIAFIVTTFFIIFLMRELVKKHTGIETSDNNVKNRLPYSAVEHFRKLWIVGFLSVLAAGCSVAYDILLIERGYFVDIMWALDFVATALYSGMFTFTVLAIWDDVKTRYMYS